MTISPIAEWMGVCIMQFDGDVLNVYDGKPFYTDGFFYIMLGETHEGKWAFGKFESESDCKIGIEALSADTRKRYANMEFIWKVVLKSEPLTTPIYEWDDKARTFRVVKEPTDGQSRIKR